MDSNHFDHATRQFGTTTNRRSAIRLLGIFLLGTVAGIGGSRQKASAAPDCCPADHPRRCGLLCVNLQNDRLNCGSCGTVCGWGKICRNGSCATAASFTSTAIAERTSTARAGKTATRNAAATQTASRRQTATRRAELTKTASSKQKTATRQAELTATAQKTPTPLCVPDATEYCYSGPKETLDVGPCKAGIRTCNAQGDGWGPCIGEILPQTETCNNIDDNCDGLVDVGAVCPDSGNGRPQTCVAGVCQE